MQNKDLEILLFLPEVLSKADISDIEEIYGSLFKASEIARARLSQESLAKHHHKNDA